MKRAAVDATSSGIQQFPGKQLLLQFITNNRFNLFPRKPRVSGMLVNVSYTVTVILSQKDTQAYGRNKQHPVPLWLFCDIPTTDDTCQNS